MYQDIPYNLWLFKERLYFHHANYRPYITYKRVRDEVYRADAVQSIARGQQVNSVNGFWPFAGLAYSRIEETLSYDGFHVLMGIANYTLQTLLGLRKVSQATRKYCQSTNSHPEIWQVEQKVGPRIYIQHLQEHTLQVADLHVRCVPNQPSSVHRARWCTYNSPVGA